RPYGWRMRRVLVAVGLVGLGLLASVATAELFAHGVRLAVTGSVWAASIGLVVVGATIRGPVHLGFPKFTRARIVRVVLVLAIIGLALALRLPRLATIPPD